MSKFRFLNQNRVTKLPDVAGVYCFKSKERLLYIGKAANIKERVKSHFQNPTYRDNLCLGLSRQVGYIKTDSEIEALILEANLIKKYQPKYNIAWKDDKNYFYIEITDEELPRLFITHQIKIKSQKPKVKTANQNSKFIGPFVEGTSLKRTLTYLRRIFPYYTTKSHPKSSCLWCSLKLCPGPNPVKSDYRKNIKSLTSVLKGNSKNVLDNLKRKMNRFSAILKYEEAAKIRDKITALEKVISHARVFEPQAGTPKTWENTQRIMQKILKTGKKISQRIEAFDISDIQGKTAAGSMAVFIQGLPHKNFYRKFKIKIQGKPNDTAMIEEIISRRFKHSDWPYPDLIFIDGGIGQLNAALKAKNQKSKTELPFMKAKVKKRTKSSSSVKNIKVIALAKKENKLYIEGRKKPILLKSLPREIFNLILHLRDEAHRFAIAYHHKLRTGSLIPK